MEKRKRIAAQLPQDMIQHVQSFLNIREAIRTTLVSKFWYNAWLTRPNLDLDERYFPPLGIFHVSASESAFLKYAIKTLQRYDELDGKIRSFRLRMLYGQPSHASYRFCQANEMIAIAMKLGATDFDIEIKVTFNTFIFVLSHDVLQSQTLVKLCLTRGAIDLRDRKISCWRLKFLNLRGVRIDGDNLWDNILMCPSIEELVLFECKSNNNNNANVNDNSRDTMFVLKPAGVCVDNWYYVSHKMRVLLLEKVKIGDWFFYDVSRFPCLKELTVNDCREYQKIRICSNSLECVSFDTNLWKLSLEFDVPRIRKFKYAGIIVPFLCFKTTSREWESDLRIRGTIERPRGNGTGTTYFRALITSWFHMLREFLVELNPSKTSLSLRIVIFQPNTSISLKEGCDYTGDIIIPGVEKLSLLISAPFSVYSAVLENLFTTCRPNFLTLYYYWLPSSTSGLALYSPFQRYFIENNDFTRFVYNTLIKKVSDYENRNASILPPHGLEEVYVEFFEDDITITGRRLLSWVTFLEATNSGKIKMEICLQLKWG